jgi:serine/threonine protein kinase/Tol biopolymer transport system component
MIETVSPHTTIAQYTIVAKIGEGGMGEVYRAHDARLDRKVAIKVLPTKLSSDQDRLKRFEQEARATSALNHSNILTIYDIGTHNGSPYIVAELLEGEELRDRLDAGTIPSRKVVDYAQQIVRGLAAAHEKGIVHRDLKPENLFITKDERVKILDFGLAKLSEPAGSSNPDISEDATRKVLTNPGVVMGTVGYMSPEQVRGEKADYRSDIFSFGAILHEMITGRRAFKRETMAETMTAILKEEPEELSASNPNINPSLERIVNRCLEKKPERRFQSTADLSFALEALSAPTNSSGSGLTTAAAVAVAETKRSVWRERVPWIAAAIFFLSFLAALPFAIKYFRQPTPAQPVAANFLITPPGAATAEKSTGFSQIAISPDGRNLVFNTSIDGQNQMWIRPLNSTTPKRLAGTDGANGFMFWSPDSRSVVFLAAGKIKKIDVVAGLVQEICDFAADRRGFGGSWSRDGTIIFSMGGLGIYRVPASGGKPTAIPGFEKSEEVLKRWPQFLPDSRHFLYLATTALKNSSEVMVGSIDGGEPKRLFPSTSNALYAPSLNGVDHIIFSRGGALLAQSFDADNLVVIGEPSRVADQVRINSNSHAFVSVSDNGTLVFDPSSDLENRQLSWFDRSGKQLETVGPIGSYLRARLSPDQKRIAVARRDPGAGVFDIFVYDIARGTSSRVTTSNSDVESLAWSPDGNYIIWSSRQVTKSEMYRKLASGAGEVEVIAQSSNPIGITDWSKDGKFILYTDADPTTNLNLWVLPLEGERKPYVYFQTPDEDGNGRFSSDGRFIVYRSRESGTNEIYVQTFPASGMKLPISTNGGTNPVWAPSGKELFFIAPDGKLMSVDIGAGSSFEPGKSRVLFDIIAARTNQGNDYDVSTDGQRFLFISRMADATSSLAVVINWSEDLKK